MKPLQSIFLIFSLAAWVCCLDACSPSNIDSFSTARAGDPESSAGSTWKVIPSANVGTTADLNSVAGNASLFVVVGASGTIIRSTDGGNRWSPAITSGTTNDLFGVTQGALATDFVAVGGSRTASTLSTIIHSADAGQTWTPVSGITTSKPLFGVAFSPFLNKFVAVGASGLVWTSINGVHWAQIVPMPSVNFTHVAWGGSLFVAVAETAIFTSSDGVTWTNQASGLTGLQSVAFSGMKWVASGLNGLILSSPPNGTIWSMLTPTPSAFLDQNVFGLAWVGNQFIAVGESGFIASSVDGSTWKLQTPLAISSLDFRSVAGTPGKSVVVGRSGLIITSP